VIFKHRLTLPKFEAQQSSRGRKPVLAAATRSTSLPVGTRALRISIPVTPVTEDRFGGQLDVLNSKTVGITR
jgi:hypothetical protein